MNLKYCLFVCLGIFVSSSSMAAVDLNEVAKMLQRHSQGAKNALDNTTESFQILKKAIEQLGYSDLAQKIIDQEIEAHRTTPLRIPSDYCLVPEAYLLQSGRHLVNCESISQKHSFACMNVNSDFLGEDLSSNPLVEGSEFFSVDNHIRCKIIKK